MRKIGKHYPNCGYGGTFFGWIFGKINGPYGSYGNGAAMRVSAAADAARSLEEAKALARAVTVVTHDHPESIRAVEALAGAIFLAREGMDMTEIRYYIMDYYDLDFTLDSIRDGYEFDVSCQGSVPVALEAFLESDSFEDAIRNAISVGGDSDTIAAITGALAEAYYGAPGWMADKAIGMLNHHLREIVHEFYINGNVYFGARFAEARAVEEEAPENICEGCGGLQ
jgi:ADP-ribosylglycohydrolase